MQNLLGIIIIIAIGIWVAKMLLDKKKQEIKEWPDLPTENQEYFLQGMQEPMLFPQYGYYKYRSSYFMNCQIPCIIMQPEIAEEQLVFRFENIMDKTIGYGDLSSLVFLGQEKPKLIHKI